MKGAAFFRLWLLGALVLSGTGCGDDDDNGTAAGGAGGIAGASASGGNAGPLSIGGTATAGNPSTGGASAGGATSTGGTAGRAGGAAAGEGGTAMGGAPTGGSGTAGVAAGGVAAGGSETGGVDTGGATAGGAATGGTNPGGATSIGGSGGSDCNLADTIPVSGLPTIAFDRYHSPAELATYLNSVALAVPAVATYHVLGQSVQGRDVVYLVIDATCQASPPAILAVGTHHGDEKSTTEAVLSMPDYLLRKSATDASVRNLLRQYAFYLLPLVNPDGYALGVRTNANGKDLNRDYSYPDRDDANSFTEAETRLVKSLHESVKFHASIAYHSGTVEVLWPWCYTTGTTADDSFFTTAGMMTAQAMGFAVYQQSANDYVTQGEYIDYAYWKDHTLAATFEISMDRTPSVGSLAAVVDNTWNGSLAWVQAVSNHDSGSLFAVTAASVAGGSFPGYTPFDGKDRLE